MPLWQPALQPLIQRKELTGCEHFVDRFYSTTTSSVCDIDRGAKGAGFDFEGSAVLFCFFIVSVLYVIDVNLDVSISVFVKAYVAFLSVYCYFCRKNCIIKWFFQVIYYCFLLRIIRYIAHGVVVEIWQEYARCCFVCLAVFKNCLVGWSKWTDLLTRATEVELYSRWSMRWHVAGGKCMLPWGTKPLHSCHFGMTARLHFCQLSRFAFSSRVVMWEECGPGLALYWTNLQSIFNKCTIAACESLFVWTPEHLVKIILFCLVGGDQTCFFVLILCCNIFCCGMWMHVCFCCICFHFQC